MIFPLTRSPRSVQKRSADVPSSVDSARRAVKAIKYLAGRDGGTSVSELAEALSMADGVVSRILMPL